MSPAVDGIYRGCSPLTVVYTIRAVKRTLINGARAEDGGKGERREGGGRLEK